MQQLIVIFAITSILSIWILLAIGLIKVSSDRGYSTSYKIMAFIPILNFVTLAKILNTNFWKIFGIIILLSILVRIGDVGIMNAFGRFPSDGELVISLLLSCIVNVLPAWYIWSKMANEGGHENAGILGFLAGIPIIGVFILFFIIWKGEW